MTQTVDIWQGFPRRHIPASKRLAIQLTTGNATCYPLYYFIDTISKDGRKLVYHRAEAGKVQIHVLDLVSGESRQLTHASAPATCWVPWCVESGKGVLDHRSVLDVRTDRLVYFDGNIVRQVGLDGKDDQQLFALPEDRIPIGQNCMSGDGNWFVYIHHDRELFAKIVESGYQRHLSRGTTLAAFNISTGEQRNLVHINSPIHHVLPLGPEGLVFCHPAMEKGMLFTDIRGGWYTHMRTQDECGGEVCHYLVTDRGIMYEVLGRKDAVLAGLYNPRSQRRYELKLPSEFGYTHTGRDPEGRLWFFENSSKTHDLRFLVRHDPAGQTEQDTVVLVDNDKPAVHITGMGYAIGHYARWVRRGAMRVEAESSDPLVQVTAFRDDADKRLVLVVINNSHHTQPVSIAAQGLSLAGPISGEQSTAQAFWKALPPVDIGPKGAVSLDVPGLSVTSLAVPVSIKP